MFFQKRVECQFLFLVAQGTLARAFAGLTFCLMAWSPLPAWSENRVLLVISELDSRGFPELQPLYQKIEDLAIQIPLNSPRFSKQYRRIHFLRDHHVTKEGVFDFMARPLEDPQVDRVDVILGVHGRPDQLVFFDQTVNVHHWVEDFRSRFPAENRSLGEGRDPFSKLGMMYNLSCYGASHNSAFQKMGFQVVIGSRRVNANAQLEYPWVLEGLARGLTVGKAFRRPNSPVWLRAADEPVRWIGRQQRNFLQEVDSYKVVSGDANFRLIPLQD